jgi:hypothetical protein
LPRSPAASAIDGAHAAIIFLTLPIEPPLPEFSASHYFSHFADFLLRFYRHISATPLSIFDADSAAAAAFFFFFSLSRFSDIFFSFHAFHFHYAFRRRWLSITLSCIEAFDRCCRFHSMLTGFAYYCRHFR